MWLSPALLLLILLGCSSVASAISGPEVVSGPEWGSLTVQCRYDSGWETYRKWWCRGAYWGSCNIIIVTSGSENEVKTDHLSIRDSHKDLMFTVTMEDLRKDDADTYWCGIERSGSDLGVQVKVIITPGYSTARNPVTIPETTSGPELDSLTMQCSYDQEWETYRKRWCQGADMDRCRILVTTGSQQQVQEYRVPTAVSQNNHTFNMTMIEPKRDYTDTCWCQLKINGIECGVKVKVDLDPREPTLPWSLTSHSSVRTVPQWSLGQRILSSEVLLCFAVLAMV
ncbi:CMRF35-like molecule 7 [Nycticebus coucang]|uniref:CMRF35-like molecule 7 n=1 Tax=Nycticebus coucang TaxID=9470 RepID=UPI00234D658B|nr:CMRF35-like molecule 7 [Nycticebus coucang]